jgi:hypothetical protein
MDILYDHSSDLCDFNNTLHTVGGVVYVNVLELFRRCNLVDVSKTSLTIQVSVLMR